MGATLPVAVASSLEKACLDLLTADGAFAKVEVGKYPENLIQRPGCNFAVVEGPFEIQGSKLNQQHILVALLVVKHVRIDSEIARRRIMHPLVQWLAVRLHGQNLGLPIQGLSAIGWAETTNAAQLSEGLMSAEVKFSTKSEVPLPDLDENARALESIIGHIKNPDTGVELETFEVDLPS